MDSLIIILVWIFPLWIAGLVLSYQRAALTVTTLGVSVLLLVLSLLTHPGYIALAIIWAAWAIVAVILNTPPLRRWLISNRLLLVVARNIPRFSATEQAVLAAGNVGWEQELLSGMPDFAKLSNMPWVWLSAAEQAFLDGPVTELCASIDPWWINSHQQIPDAIWAHLKQHGYFGLVIPVEYGGKGFSAFAHAQVIMKLASVSTAVATVASVPNSLGPAELLLHYGTPGQKNYYLPRLARGEEIPCFALTSPVAGSDASAMIDSGVVCRYVKNDKEILGVRLNWDKRYITLAPVATLLGLAFRLYDPEHLLGDQEELGITCALIPTHTPGVRTGRRHDPLNCAFPNGPTQGVEVLVELDAIIGGVSQAGKGWQMLMERLAAGRSISLPSITMGSIKVAAASSGAYARARRQFNTYIGDFGGIQAVLARIAGWAYTAESLRLFSIAQVDQGIHSATAAAIGKYHTTELGRKIIQGAMDIHGGKGICRGPHNYLAQMHMESPIAITVEGANILTRSLIIFGQGVLRCHPFLLREIHAVQKKDKKAFDQAFFAHIGYFFSNQVRALIFAFGNQPYDRRLSRFSAVLAATVDILLMTMGGALKRKELLSARLGDLLSDLYIVSAILKHYQTQQENPAMASLVAWSCQELFAHFERQLTDLFANLPNRFAAWWLRLIVFPLGKSEYEPHDLLTVTTAKELMEPGPIREDLMAGAYFGGILADLENKLRQIIAVEPLLQTIHQAKRQRVISGRNLVELIADALDKQVISAHEAKEITAVEIIRTALTTVDDFS